MNYKFITMRYLYFIPFVALVVCCKNPTTQDSQPELANKPADSVQNNLLLTRDEVLMLLPDSCFKKFYTCVPDSTIFSKYKRHALIDNPDSCKKFLLWINKEENENTDETNYDERTFSIISDQCIYGIELKFTWWNISNRILILTALSESDNCVDREEFQFYEYNSQKLKATHPLPALTIANFVKPTTLKKLNIDPSIPAPINLNWNKSSDTIQVSLEFGITWNCPDSDTENPLIKLKKEHIQTYHLLFTRKDNQFVQVE